MKLSAHQIAGSPELYNKVVRIGNNDYECYGYTVSGKMIKFACLVPDEHPIDSDNHWSLHIIVRYFYPDDMLNVIE